MKKIGVILAGGKSSRMERKDKGKLELCGSRLIDHVIERFGPQVDRLLISGPDDYGSGLTAIEDIKDGVKGPAAGLFSFSKWLKANEPDADGFFTVPVDGPFLPEDLCVRFREAKGTAIAADDDGVHPTFAFWRLADLERAFGALSGAPSVSLHALAAASGAERIYWEGTSAFLNINTIKDLEKAKALAKIQS